MQNIAIIGGGLGGLTSGALLAAKKGYKVTLLEQHAIVGGCATMFKRKGGFTCEVGLHEMDGVYSNNQIKQIFEELDVYSHVEFVKPDELFKVITTHGEFVMPDNKDEAQIALIKRFPKEKEAIKGYFHLIEKISKQLEELSSLSWFDYFLFPVKFATILKYKSKDVAEVLDTLSQNEELKLILNSNVMYYNNSPKTLNFILHAVAQYSYYNGSGWFIKGGSYELSKYLASVITANGGSVITKANVIKADVTSVTYMHQNNEHTIYADKIISNISPQDTYKIFNIKYEEQKQIAESITTVYFGFNADLKELYPEGKYSTFLLDTLSSQNDFVAMAEKDVTQKDFVFVDYSRVDSALTPKGKSFGAVCMLDEMKNWEGLEKEEYKVKQALVYEHVIERLEKHYPNIKEVVEYAEVATPKTMQRYLKTPQGTAYGYKPTPKQFFRAPKVKSDKVKNLYFVGQFIMAGGFSPAIASGALCAEAIVKEG